MTDRELLELAAKAAGFGAPGTGGTCWTESEYPRGSGLNGALWNYVGFMDEAQLWNPLTDDGDAFRLAVELSMVVDVKSGVSASVNGQFEYASNNNGLLAAARRAVVRAAAEIGKAMP